MAHVDETYGVSVQDLCQLFERLHDGAFFWDAELKLIACNAFGCRLCGLDPSFMTPGRDYLEMIAALPPGRFMREVPSACWQSIHAPDSREEILEDYHRRVAFEVRFEGPVPRVLIGARATFRDGVLASVMTDVTEREENSRTIEREKSYLATIIDNLEEGVALFDEEHRLVASNRGLTALYELGPAAVEPGASLRRVVRGIGDLERLPEPARERAVEKRLRWAGAGTPGRDSLIDEMADGRSIEISRIGLDDGRSVFVARDATERVELSRQSAVLAAIVDNIPEGALLMDDDGRLVAFNTQFLDQYSIPHDALRPGQHVSRAVALEQDLGALPEDEQERLRAARLDFALKRQEGRVQELRELGDGRTISVTRTPLEGRTLFTYYDVTAEQERKNLLDQARQEAERASRMQSEFLARMSHELRTPMQGVLGMAAVLERSGLDPHQQQCLQVIRSSGRHMLALIEDLLTVSAMDAEGLSLHPRPVPLARPLAEAVEMVRPQADEQGLSLAFDARRLDGTVVEVDMTRLRQILINLLGNAVRYTRSGGVTVSAAVAPAGEGRLAVEIAVSDTGPGIASERQEEIFDRFRQLEPAQGEVKEGVGLGLPIARSLARAMGGDVTVNSGPGGGATFTLRLDLPEVRGDAVAS